MRVREVGGPLYMEFHLNGADTLEFHPQTQQ